MGSKEFKRVFKYSKKEFNIPQPRNQIMFFEKKNLSEGVTGVSKREEAPGHDDLKTPVRGVDGKHAYKEKPPVGFEEKHLQTPVLGVEGNHG